MSGIPQGWIKERDGSYSPPKKITDMGSAANPASLLADASDALPARVEFNPAGGMVKAITVNVEPIGAPRMTRRDKWLNPRRPCVQRYFDFRDVIKRGAGLIPTTPDELHLRFHIPMPDSWPKKRCAAMNMQPHRQRPDYDNLCKAVGDSLFDEDCAIWKGSQEKLWCERGQERIEITMIWKAK